MRLQDRPRSKASAVGELRGHDHRDGRRPGDRAGRAATRRTAGCSTPGEAALAGAGDRRAACSCSAWSRRPARSTSRLTELLRPGPRPRRRGRARRRDGAAGTHAADAWRSTFLRMPYVRDGLARMSAIVETFETASTWDRVDELYATVPHRGGRRDRARSPARPGWSTAGSPTSTPTARRRTSRWSAPAGPGSEVAMWDDVKTAAMEVLGRLRRHDHPPPRRRPRPPARLRPAASRAVRRRAAGGEGGARPGRGAQPGRADRPRVERAHDRTERVDAADRGEPGALRRPTSSGGRTSPPRAWTCVGEARLVDAMLARGSRVLDAGCGQGRIGGHLDVGRARRRRRRRRPGADRRGRGGAPGAALAGRRPGRAGPAGGRASPSRSTRSCARAT